MASPTTLLEIIEGSAANAPNFMAEPPLGHKFALARQLTSSIALFHASQWLHKAFRSDNILFFGDTTKPDALLDPYISGFESSREISSESIGYRPTGSGPVDYFYHPSSIDGFTKPMDLYSFGVVLLEIAYWRPLRAKIQKARAQSSLHEIQRLFVKTAKNQLPAMTGSIYAEAVTRCLECALPDETDEDFTCAMSIEVISKLESCRA
ncbi:hypothetical protein GQ53DRAFT_750750 [Thozetella sp. PMI_491]|nr:hypothetical protein GQ53DRAFT_750750 [Thozetella sp. PMI_491]